MNGLVDFRFTAELKCPYQHIWAMRGGVRVYPWVEVQKLTLPPNALAEPPPPNTQKLPGKPSP